MRDRLIEILKRFCTDDCKITHQCGYCDFGDLTVCPSAVADHLLANGVIVPPCKVGDITYVFDYEVNNHLETKFRGIAPSVVEAIVIEDEGLWIENEHAKYHISSVGELIFLTKEEAEKALAERSGK